MKRLNKAALILLLNVIAVGTSLAAIIPTHTPITAGCADTFATSKVGGTLYRWNFGANTYPSTFSSALPAAGTVFLTPGSHTIYVTITTGGGTVADSVTVNVLASSDTVSLKSNMPVCQEVNTAVTFSASPTGYLAYAFFVNDSLEQLGTSNTFSFDVAAGDSFRVFGFNGTCFTAASNTLYDHTPQPPTLTSTLPAGDTICAGDTVIFTATPTAVGDSFLFYVGGSLQQGSPANTWSSSTLQDSSTIIAFVYNQFGCRNYFYSNQILVRVKPTPQMTLTASDSFICPNTPVVFTGASLQANANSYTFSINSVVEQSGPGNTYSTSGLVNNDTIRVTGTLNGCTGKPSPPVIESVFSAPTLSITSNAPGNGICQGGRVVFAGIPSTYQGYQFFVNGISADSGSSPTYTSDSITNGVMVYVIAYQAGCPPPPSDTITMSIVPGPTVTVGPNLSSCYPGPAETLSGFSPIGGFWTGQGITDTSGIFNPDSAGVGIWPLTYTFIDSVNGCSGHATITDTVNAATLSNFQTAVQICHGSVTLSAIGASSYIWSPSTGLSCDTCVSPVASPTETTTYYVTAAFAGGCVATDSVVVSVNNLTTAPLFTDTSIAAGTPIVLIIDTIGSTGPVSYTWVPSDSINNTHIPAPTVSPTVTTVYTLFDTSGTCTDSFSITVNVSAADTFAVPTGFSPNGDGHDDYLYPVFNAKGTGRAVVKAFRIYNRYGQLVYNNPSNPGWDGRFKGAEQPVGTYVFYIAVQFPDTQSEKHMEGSVTLLR